MKREKREGREKRYYNPPPIKFSEDEDCFGVEGRMGLRWVRFKHKVQIKDQLIFML